MAKTSNTWIFIVGALLVAAVAFLVLRPSAEAETPTAASVANAAAIANPQPATPAGTAPPVAIAAVGGCLTAAGFDVEVRGPDRLRIRKGDFGPLIVWFFPDAATATRMSPSKTWAPVNNTLVQSLSWMPADAPARVPLSACLGA